mgnify:CR=1 FL=1
MLKDSKGMGYYTPKEIAEMFRVSDRTVYAWIRTGKIVAEAYRIGRKLISEIELENFINNYWGK